MARDADHPESVKGRREHHRGKELAGGEPVKRGPGKEKRKKGRKGKKRKKGEGRRHGRHGRRKKDGAVNHVPAALPASFVTPEDSSVAIILSGRDGDGDPLTYEVVEPPGHGILTGDPPETTYIPAPDFNGKDSFAFTVRDPSGASSPPAYVEITVTAVNDPPVAMAEIPAATVRRLDEVCMDGGGSADVDGDALSYKWSFGAVPAGSVAVIDDSAAVSSCFVPDLAGDYLVRLEVSDGAAVAAAEVAVSVSPRLVVVPDLSGLTKAAAGNVLAEAGLSPGDVRGEYSDTVAAGTVMFQFPAASSRLEEQGTVDLVVSLGPQYIGDPGRPALITGQVQDADGTPVAGVEVSAPSVSVGPVATDSSGRYSLSLMGGMRVRLVFVRDGFIACQRDMDVPVNEIVDAGTVTMTAIADASTRVAFDGVPDTVTVHRGSRAVNGGGFVTLVFRGDNRAWEVDEQGNLLRELAEITVRATEFPGPLALPAPLPAGTDYTYCVELAADGIERVRFARPVTAWIGGLSGARVGDVVPVGYLDRDQGRWLPSDNGVVVRLLDTDGDSAADAVDADGDGLPDDIDGDGRTDGETLGLDDPSLYPPGAVFWRVPVGHFTPYYTGVPVTPAPRPAVSVEVNPPVVVAGEKAVLSWSVENADTVSIDNGVGQVDVSGSLELYPEQSVTYHVSASGPGGSSEASVAVGVIGVQRVGLADEPGDYFAWGVAVDGFSGYAAFGAPYDDEAGYDAGAVYVFQASPGGWNMQEKITAADASGDEMFGATVAIDGDYIVVGAPDDDDSGPYSGSAYIFKRSGGGWAQQAKLVAADASSGDEFGSAVALDGEYAVIGACYADDDLGAVYVFRREGENWVQQAKLTPSDGEPGDEFGTAVAVSGDYIFVGAPYSGDDYSGAVYVFRRDGAGWYETAKLKGSDTAYDDEFGGSLSADGDTLVVGAEYNSTSAYYGGAAYVFRRDGGQWREEARLSPPDAAEYDYIAGSVAVYGRYVAVEAYMRDSVYLYRRTGEGWSLYRRIRAPSGLDGFGYPVAMGMGYCVVGADENDAAFIYAIPDAFAGISVTPEYAPDGAATLRWKAFNSESCAISPDIGPVESSGTTAVSAAGTTVYTLSCEGPFGAASAQATLNVSARPAEVYASIDPPLISSGDQAVISWQTYGAQSCLIEPGGADCLGAGSLAVSPDATTVYTLTAANADGVETSVKVAAAVQGRGESFSLDFVSGRAVATDGPWTAADQDGAGVVIFHHGPDGWAEFASISPADAPDDLTFGEDLALSGDLLVVGAPGQDAVYVFRWDGNAWNEEARLTAPGVSPGDEFGSGVDVDGDTIVVRSDFNDRVHVFRHDPDGWRFEAELTGGVMASGFFGADVAVSGDYIVVGDDGGKRIFTFRRMGSEWFLADILESPVRDYYSDFGEALDMNGDLLIVGDSEVGYGYYDYHGAAYIYRRRDGSWVREADLLPERSEDDIYYGEYVAINGDYAVVSAWYTDSAMYRYHGGSWEPTGWLFGYNGVTLALGDEAVVEGGSRSLEITDLPVPVVRMDAAPRFAPDGRATLSWEANDAVACRILPGAVDVGPSGSLDVRVVADTRFVIRCETPYGVAEDHVTVHPRHPPPEIVAVADPPVAYPGETVTIRWGSMNADAVEIDQGLTASGTSGSLTVKPTADVVYRLKATGPGGETETTVSVRVIDPMVAISAPEPYYLSGGYGRNYYVRLDWAKRDLESCTIYSHHGGYDCNAAGRDSGYIWLVAVGDDTFTIKGTDARGKVYTDSVDVYAVTANLWTPDSVVPAGTPATLRWETTHLSTCVINPGNHDCGGADNGTVTVTPSSTTTYTLTGTAGRGITVEASRTIEVIPPVSAEFSVNPRFIIADGSSSTVELTWTTANADRVRITSSGPPFYGLWQPVAPSGTLRLYLSAGTTFTLRAGNSLGGPEVSRYRQVTLIGPGYPGVGILYPEDNGVVNGRTTLVRGLVGSPSGDPRVTVNGRPAQVYGNTFFLNNLELSEGVNTIEVVATEPGGASVSDTITVTRDTSAGGFDLKVENDYGIAPLRTRLTAEITPWTGGSYELGYMTDGDGEVFFTPISSVEHNLSFSLPGLYTVRYSYTPPGGGTSYREVMVRVDNVADLDAMLRKRWEGMKSFLAVRDVEGALQYFTEGARDKYRAIFNGIYSDLPMKIRQMRDIEMIYGRDDIAKYRITRDQLIGGELKTITYYIYFIRDQYGEWRIAGF